MLENANWDNLKEKYGDLLELSTDATPSFVGVDTETSGFSPEKHSEIIQLSAIRLTKQMEYDNLDELSTLIRPSKSVPKKITEVTGITDKDVFTKGMGLDKAMMKYAELKGDSILVMHNGDFDQRFFDWYLPAYQLSNDNPMIDTMTAMKALYPPKKFKSDNERPKDYPTAYRLENFLELFEIKNKNWHDAKADTYGTIVAFDKMRKAYLEHFGLEDKASYTFEDKEIPLERFEVYNDSYWGKKEHTKSPVSRLYVTVKSQDKMQVSRVFYDYVAKSWNYNSSFLSGPIDFEYIEERIIKHEQEEADKDAEKRGVAPKVIKELKDLSRGQELLDEGTLFNPKPVVEKAKEEPKEVYDVTD